MFSGVEIAGKVSGICNSIPNCNIMPGDNVIVYPETDDCFDGYQEFVPVHDADNVIQIPNNIPLEVASMLPGSALSAYNAVLKALPHVEKLQDVKCKYLSMRVTLINQFYIKHIII